MAGKESQKKRHKEHRNRSHEVNGHVDNHRKSGVLEIPSGVSFSEYVQKLHAQEARFDTGTTEHEEIGRLKYQVIAKVLDEDPSENPDTDIIENLRVPGEDLPEKRTAYRFYRSLLTVFEPFPWEIPFSAVNTLAHQVHGDNFMSTREEIKKEGSESIVAKSALKHGKLRDLWEAYQPNRSAGIDIEVYFAKHPPISSARSMGKTK